MGARRIARERALQALYQMETSALRPEDALDVAWNADPDAGPEVQSAPLAPPPPDAQAFALDLVQGVVSHRDEIDALIEEHSHNWRLDRMARVDRNVLRLAVYELRWRSDIPKKVTLNEAVELGKAFGTETSSGFVNGLLDRIALAVEKA